MTHAREGGNALPTDPYRITMLQACFDGGLHAPASFELFSRKLPADRKTSTGSPRFSVTAPRSAALAATVADTLRKLAARLGAQPH